MKFLVLKIKSLHIHSELPICRTLMNGDSRVSKVTISSHDGQVLIPGKGMVFLIAIVCIAALWPG
jgi:hypothetical protein